jgi:hypothetical protein
LTDYRSLEQLEVFRGDEREVQLLAAGVLSDALPGDDVNTVLSRAKSLADFGV